MKKFLVSVVDSIHSTHAVEYMLRMTPIMQDFIYMLFYVQPTISDYIKDESRKDANAREKLKALDEKNEALGNDILNRHKKRLMEHHVPEEKIFLLNRKRLQAAAWDIIHHAWNESVDAIVMGRRGFSKFQDIFIGSTTKSVIDHNPDTPVWVIDGEIVSKKILLAVDGSTNSIKALEYLCDILRHNPDAPLTLFHVQTSWRDCCDIDFTAAMSPEDEQSTSNIIEKANRQCIANFMEHAQNRLKEQEIPKNRMEIKTQQSKLNIGKTILEEFQNGGYGTLVVGKRGMNRGSFMGSVSNYLATHLENGALWIVP
jgi:nucleotide-binding universal stress UspA family protein